MHGKKRVWYRVLFLLGLALVVWWHLRPWLGPWEPVEAMVVGRDRDLHTPVEEDDDHEYYAVLDLCYESQGVLVLARQDLTRDSVTRWQLSTLSHAVEEAKRHRLGETRRLFVHVDSPARWVVEPGQGWGLVIFFAVLYACVSLVAFWERPDLLPLPLVAAFLLGYLVAAQDSAGVLPPELDPRPLVNEAQSLKAFERVPLEGPRKLDTLKDVVDRWGRPDAVWLEEEEAPIACLLYREGATWEKTWTWLFRRTEEGWIPIGPPQPGEHGEGV